MNNFVSKGLRFNSKKVSQQWILLPMQGANDQQFVFRWTSSTPSLRFLNNMDYCEEIMHRNENASVSVMSYSMH